MLLRSVGQSCSVVGHRSNAPRPNALPEIATTCCEVQRAAGYRSNATRSTTLLAIAAALQRPARCCNSATRTLQAVVRCWPTPQERSWPSLQCCEELQCSATARHRRSGG
jgi:hypothetical protein